MATPSPEMMASLLANPEFQRALRDHVRGYRWRWRRVSGNRWVVDRDPVRLISSELLWDWVTPHRKTISTGATPTGVPK